MPETRRLNRAKLSKLMENFLKRQAEAAPEAEADPMEIALRQSSKR